MLKIGDETTIGIDEIEFAAAPSKHKASRGTLSVVGNEDCWVALAGPQHDYFKAAQENIGNRTVRVERLIGPRYDQVPVRICRQQRM